VAGFTNLWQFAAGISLVDAQLTGVILWRVPLTVLSVRPVWTAYVHQYELC
jgi:hypothetical protein